MSLTETERSGVLFRLASPVWRLILQPEELNAIRAMTIKDSKENLQSEQGGTMENQPEAMTYNILPGPKMGLVTPEYLEQVAYLARKYHIPFLKITGAQRIAIAGHTADTAKEIWQEMGQPSGPQKPVGIHYIQACPGVKWCKYGKQDSLALGACRLLS